MARTIARMIALTNFGMVVALGAAWQAQAADAKAPYPSMAPFDQYLMDRDAEIALVRSAAPASISNDAKVQVLGRKGCETAVEGKNGFVCVVERSWGSDFDDPEFWNTRIRGPVCYNPPAARSILPARAKRQEMILAGLSKTQVFDGIKAAFNRKELPNPEPGSMCYMMSKEAYLNDQENHNLAHLMFEVPRMDGAALGADLPGSRVMVGSQDGPEPTTEFIVPVGQWSDGTAVQAENAQTPDPSMATIRPFKAHVPDSVLIDLRRRLAETKWPDQLPGTTWEYGVDIKKVRELADYWQNGYDWRAQEAKINQFDQFTTEIDGQQIYFIHHRSPRPDAIPLLLIHGWPGSIVEFLNLIDPLTRPKNSDTPAFDVIIPSLPGFGFSGPTTTKGWGPQRMAKALIVLMDRLGYSRYGIQGGDWGSLIAREMAYEAPEHVIGLHLNFLPVPPPNPEAVAQLSKLEQRRFSWFEREESSFYSLQASEPQTIAYALTDSPVGWLAWMIDKFQTLTDNNGDFLSAVDRDTFLTDVTLYQVTGTVGSAMRVYREYRLTGGEAAPLPRLDTPVAYADFPKEVFASPISWIDQTYKVVQMTEMPRGGHFAALEQPNLLVDDIRKFFSKVHQK
jgi:epoxide hydrolase